MHRFEEIQYLREAFAESPDNISLLWFLIRKMRVVKESHFELKPLVDRMLIKFPDDLELKEILIEIYFYQGKYDSSIVIWEDIDDIFALSPGTIVFLSKSYLRLGNVDESKRLFLWLIELWPGHFDRELEAFFRIPISKFP
jgi:hypothetical protein